MRRALFRSDEYLLNIFIEDCFMDFTHAHFVVNLIVLTK